MPKINYPLLSALKSSGIEDWKWTPSLIRPWLSLYLNIWSVLPELFQRVIVFDPFLFAFLVLNLRKFFPDVWCFWKTLFFNGCRFEGLLQFLFGKGGDFFLTFFVVFAVVKFFFFFQWFIFLLEGIFVLLHEDFFLGKDEFVLGFSLSGSSSF